MALKERMTKETEERMNQLALQAEEDAKVKQTQKAKKDKLKEIIDRDH
jgi:hypothetical protein